MSCMQFNARSYHQGGGAEGKRTEFEVARQEYSESGKEERIGGKWRKEMCSSSCRSVCLLAPAWLEGVPCCLGLASSLGGPMAPPKCSGPCGGTTLTELTSRSLRSTWRAAEGSKWSWCWHASRQSLCAYWHCCLDCHKLAWPAWLGGSPFWGCLPLAGVCYWNLGLVWRGCLGMCGARGFRVCGSARPWGWRHRLQLTGG